MDPAAFFLESVENKTPHERYKLMVELGRQSKSDEGVDNLLKALQTGSYGQYGRSLALQACAGSCDEAALLASVKSSSRSLSSLAFSLLLRGCATASTLDQVGFCRISADSVCIE